MGFLERFQVSSFNVQGASLELTIPPKEETERMLTPPALAAWFFNFNLSVWENFTHG
jgi:hypothetical protein